MSKEKVLGYTFRHSAKTLRDFPELAERIAEGAVMMIQNHARTYGHTLLTEPHLVRTVYYKNEKEAHHEHGWQWVEREVPEPEAEYVLQMWEATAE